MEFIKTVQPKCTPKYIAEKGKTYSFIVFDDIDSAKTFYEESNGIIKSSNSLGNEQIIYMTYVETGRYLFRMLLTEIPSLVN